MYVQLCVRRQKRAAARCAQLLEKYSPLRRYVETHDDCFQHRHGWTRWPPSYLQNLLKLSGTIPIKYEYHIEGQLVVEKRRDRRVNVGWNETGLVNWG